jgi:ABC-2 type transport system ATP-binding protein
MLRQNKPNDLLQAVLNYAEILSFQEIVPSMNDIFISVVENKTTVNTQSTFTE